METTKIIESTANNVDYQSQWVDKKITKETALVNNSVLNILELVDQNASFKEEIEEQSIATNLSRKLWKKGAMLKEQLVMLWLNKWKPAETNRIEVANNITFWPPNMTIPLWWLSKAA
jgi:hypothetical protein